MSRSRVVEAVSWLTTRAALPSVRPPPDQRQLAPPKRAASLSVTLTA